MAWPPTSANGLYDVLDELERSMPGAVAVTARATRRSVRSSGRIAVVPTGSEAYARARSMLAMTVGGNDAIQLFDEALAAKGTPPEAVDRATVVQVLSALMATPAGQRCAAALGAARDRI